MHYYEDEPGPALSIKVWRYALALLNLALGCLMETLGLKWAHCGSCAAEDCSMHFDKNKYLAATVVMNLDLRDQVLQPATTSPCEHDLLLSQMGAL